MPAIQPAPQVSPVPSQGRTAPDNHLLLLKGQLPMVNPDEAEELIDYWTRVPSLKLGHAPANTIKALEAWWNDQLQKETDRQQQTPGTESLLVVTQTDIAELIQHIEPFLHLTAA